MNKKCLRRNINESKLFVVAPAERVFPLYNVGIAVATANGGENAKI
ncbi:MAG TPA: hypothetical protein VJH37_02240 [Candidatus Nanoarchaeia archaeon]|nr:hypothetical protein [Candidatus Nanoarchaeia archaeon]